MNNAEYIDNEYKRFNQMNSCYFDTVDEFEKQITSKENVLEQLDWIENGSYGAGCCIALSKIWDYVKDNNRCNKAANIGSVLLQCLYGKPFKHWRKLSKSTQDMLNEAIVEWMNKEKKEFSI